MRRDKSELNAAESNSGDDSSSSEDDDNAELLTEELEKGFFRVLSRLKKKDPQLYEESVKFFPVENFEDGQTVPNPEPRKKKSAKNYKKWLKGQKEKVENEEVKKDLEALHDFWTNPKLSKDELFLRDYILNKKFLDPDVDFNLEEEVKNLSDEEKEIEEQLKFEHEYNCRLQNPGQDLLGNNTDIARKNHKENAGKKKKERDSSTETKENLEDKRNINTQINEEEFEIQQPKKKKKKNRHDVSERVENTRIDNEEDIKKMNDEDISAERKRFDNHKRKRHVELEVSTSPKIMNEDFNRTVLLHEKTVKKKRKHSGNSIGDISGEKEKLEEILSDQVSAKINNEGQKSGERKRKDSYKNKEHLGLEVIASSKIMSEDRNETTTQHKKIPKKKRKRSKNSICEDSEKRKKLEEILSSDQGKPIQNIPRHLQIRKDKRRKKLRHRTLKALKLMKMEDKVCKATQTIDRLPMEKKLHYNSKTKHFNDKGIQQNVNNFQYKANMNFQSKKFKNKKLKKQRLRNKKQKKATKAL